MAAERLTGLAAEVAARPPPTPGQAARAGAGAGGKGRGAGMVRCPCTAERRRLLFWADLLDCNS